MFLLYAVKKIDEVELSAMPVQDIRWNIFAATLQDILSHHNLHLWSLKSFGIHPQQITRLQKSLKTPQHFPLLSPVDMERLTLELPLSSDEIIRLRAAMLATAIERMLFDRISAEGAYAVAYEIFQMLNQTLQARDVAAVR